MSNTEWNEHNQIMTPAMAWTHINRIARDLEQAKKDINKIREGNASLGRDVVELEYQIEELAKPDRICDTEGHSWEVFTAGIDPLFLWCHQCGKKLGIKDAEDED